MPDPERPQVEQILAAQGVTHVVRVRDTVRRPVRPFTATIQSFLGYLHTRGFHAAPEPLGYDEQGREVLSFIEGDVPTEPVPIWATKPQVLTELARLIRRLHDAAEGWEPPPDAVFGGIPGEPPAGVRPLFGAPTLVSHQDYCPGNVVFRAGLPAALIDFDLAQPTTRVADLVNAMYWWVPLLPDCERVPALVGADAARRTRLMADAYGLTARQRALVVPTAVRRAANATLTMRAAAEVDPVFRRWWDEGVKDRVPRAQEWITGQASRLDAELRG